MSTAPRADGAESPAAEALAALQHQIALLNEYGTASEVGVLLCSTLFGVFAVQLYLYTHHTSNRSSRDSFGLQLLVGWVFVVETTHTILLWVYFVQTGRRSRFDPVRLLDLTTPLVFVYFTSAVMGATVQSYYAYRLYRFSSSLPLAALPFIGSSARLILGVAGVVMSFRPDAVTILDFMERFGWCLKGVLSASVAVDVWNTTALCVILARQRSQQLKSTARVIDRLIMWSVETGFVTSIMAVLMLIFTLLKRYTVIPGLFHVYPNMFSLSLLVTLNARDGMRQTLYSSKQWTSSSRVPSASHIASGMTTTFSFGTRDKDKDSNTKTQLHDPERHNSLRLQTRVVAAGGGAMQFDKRHQVGGDDEEWERDGYAV